MFIRIILIISWLGIRLVGVSAQQNLISNGDFEEYIQCPPYELVDTSKHFNPVNIHDIIFDWHAKRYHPRYRNYFHCPDGITTVAAESVDGYFGYFSHGAVQMKSSIGPDSTGFSNRTYLHIALLDTLNPGQLYYGELFARSHHLTYVDATTFILDPVRAVAYIGFLFEEFFMPEEVALCTEFAACFPILEPPHWQVDSMFGGMAKWERQHFCFVPDKPYSSLTIGIFAPYDTLIAIEQRSGQRFATTYHIDNVLLTQIEDSLGLDISRDTICIGESVLMTTTHGYMAASFDWDLVGANDPVTTGDTVFAVYSMPGIYPVHVTARYCSESFSLEQSGQIVVLAPPERDIQVPERIEVEQGTYVTLQSCVADDALAIRWTPPEGLSCANCHRPGHTAQASTIYTAIVEETGYCPLECEFEIAVFVPEPGPVRMFIPNAFSPNADGINDVFEVHGFDFSLERMEIYDRWGGLLFLSDGPKAAWDGKVNGKDAPTGVYVFVLLYRDGQGAVHRQTGDVQLIR